MKNIYKIHTLCGRIQIEVMFEGGYFFGSDDIMEDCRFSSAFVYFVTEDEVKHLAGHFDELDKLRDEVWRCFSEEEADHFLSWYKFRFREYKRLEEEKCYLNT